MPNIYAPSMQQPPIPSELAIASLTREPLPQLAISPVIHPRDGIADPNSRTFWSATANVLYVRREEGADLFGPTPSLANKLAQGNDLVECGRRGPIGCDAAAVEGLKLWEAADQAGTADRPSSPVAHHLIGFLPFDAGTGGWREMICTFLDQIVVSQGMVADWALHALPDGKGGWIKKPHFHAVTTSRFWKAGRRTGEPNNPWLISATSRSKAIATWREIAGSFA